MVERSIIQPSYAAQMAEQYDPEDKAGSSPASPATAPVFEVIDPKSGHRWLVFADGRVEGFGEVVIINRIPALMARRVDDWIEEARASQGLT